MLVQHPSDCHPDLQEEHLLALAHFFASTRSGVAALHDPLAGDDAWALGCRGNARWRNLLLRKHKSGEWPWFSVLNPGKKFIFAIGSVPVRFYRGNYKRPPSRTLAQSAQELSQLSLAFSSDEQHFRELNWRFAIETDFLGEPSKVIFAALAKDDGAAVHHWELPFDKENIVLQLNDISSDDMVELPAPTVGSPTTEKKAAINDD